MAVGQNWMGVSLVNFWDYLNSLEEWTGEKGREENSYEWKESGKAEGGEKGKKL